MHYVNACTINAAKINTRDLASPGQPKTAPLSCAFRISPAFLETQREWSLAHLVLATKLRPGH